MAQRTLAVRRVADAATFEDLYRANVRRINAFASARLGRDDGEEVTAEVFHAAVVAFRSGDGDRVTEAWLFSVARNKVVDRWRTAGRRKAKAHLLRLSPDERMAFPSDWADDHKRDAVVDALGAIKERHRMLLILHHVDGHSIMEVAAMLDSSESAIESALARARHAFRREFIDPTGGGS